MRLGDSHSGRATAAVSFRGQDLVIECPQSHAEAFPRVEVVCRGDCSAGSVGLTDGPVLLKGRCSLDGGCVGTGCLINLVSTAVTGNGAFICKASAGVVGAEVLGDIVLDQRVGGPAVDREIAVAAGLIVGRERDVSAM